MGESGSGKSTLAAAILNLISRRSGAIEFEGRPIGDASRRERRALARHLQVVFQDPLLLALQRKYGISYLVISHDLAVVNAMAHRVYVMKDGEIVETGETEAVLKAPRHPYTQSLVAAL